jgi:CubicO group peptidase (beta-lactamase class C family)
MSALRDLADYAAAQKTTGLLVWQDGRTVLEQNWPLPEGSEQFAAIFTRGTTDTGAPREDVASQQKSLIGVLAGQAVDRGLLDIARPVSSYVGEGWSKAAAEQERAITVRHLLEMTSGLSEPPLAFEAPAGERFAYNTTAYARLHGILEAAAGMKLDALTRDWLTGPLGMSDTAWMPRPEAIAKASGNAWGLVTAPRDLLKLGQMLMDDGRAPGGTQIISEAQLAAMLTPTATNPAYGRLWWLNSAAWRIDVTGNRLDGAPIPSAPSDLVLALGAQGRVLGVLPSRKLIVVRLGQQPPDADFHTQFWRRVMAVIG